MSRKARHLPPDTDRMIGRAPMAPDDIARRQLSRRLVEVMMERDLKQADIAEGVFGKNPKTGYALGRDSVSQWVRGRSLPEPRNLQWLADFLGMDRSELVPPSAFNRQAHEDPAVELRQVSGEPGMAWIRVNRACSTVAAAQILDILNKDDEKKRK